MHFFGADSKFLGYFSDMEVTKLSEKRNQLLANLDLNTKDLQKAQDLAAAQPSEMSGKYCYLHI